MKDYKGLRQEALHTLEHKLPNRMHYHGTSHTMDVLKVCNQYIERGNIEPEAANLLRIGALLHDLGFTVATTNHESHSMEIATTLMGKYGYSPSDIEIVRGLIRATRIPQSPETWLEEIICDSDLDYLGRDDYYTISSRLFKELVSFGFITERKEWNMKQIDFLESHRYHTTFARRCRQPAKEERIKELRALTDHQR